MASLNRSLVDGEKPERPQSPALLDPKSEQSDLDQGSTRAPSTAPDVVDYEKKETSGIMTDDEETKETVPVEEQRADDEPKSEEYPAGTRLIFIVIALVLSVFLVALDMVSS